MKVTSLYPIIVAEQPEDTIAFYKKLGFEQKHDKVTRMNTHVYVLSNGAMELEIMEKVANGPVELPTGLYGFRMNVDDIDEAYEECKKNGCTIIKPPFDTDVSINMLVKDNQGVNITIMQHKK